MLEHSDRYTVEQIVELTEDNNKDDYELEDG